ncbi:hypothetical protein L0Y59_01695 [Candidatus Uhrbacteria bacterium]|nr:hypothetical protein [Candidatus Uhrbacteria bacterium]
MFDRKTMSASEAEEERKTQLKDLEAIEHLKGYAQDLGRAEALEVEGEYQRPDDVPLPVDLTAFGLEGNRSVSSRGVEKVAFEALAEDAERRGVELDADASRALNNLLQLEHVGHVVERRASLSIDRPSAERESLMASIAAKKIEIIAGIIGDDEVDRLRRFKEAFGAKAADPEWQEEHRRRLDGIKSVLRSPQEMLAAMRYIQGVGMSDVPPKDAPVSLESIRERTNRLKRIEEAEEAFRTGDPSIIRHADPLMEGLAEGERVRRTDMNQRRTEASYRFYRETMRDILRKMNMTTVRPEP